MNRKKCVTIGVFDSGIGGLTVLHAINRLLPGANVIYFGDTARVPYGGKSQQTIITYSKQIVDFLNHQAALDLIVVACNTATALALPLLQKMSSIPIIGVIEPAVRMAIENSGAIAVIGTKATIASGEYQHQIRRLDRARHVFTLSCPLFVPLVEEGLVRSPIADASIDHYLATIKKKKIETLILGCTHYPLLKTRIKAYLGAQVKLIDSARETALCVRDQIGPVPGVGTNKIFVSDDTDAFIRAARFIRFKRLDCVKQVSIAIMELGDRK